VMDVFVGLYDETIVALYCITLQQALSPAVRAHLEALAMNAAAAPAAPDDPLTTWMFDRIRARREALREGRAEGMAEGKAEGRAEGKAEGKAESVLLVLRQRGVPVDDSALARIRAETDTSVLDAWLVASLGASTVGELFEAPR
jgi:hypothetical protein